MKSGSSIENATVLELKVKVPPGVLSSGKMATEDLLLGASANMWTLQTSWSVQ